MLSSVALHDRILDFTGDANASNRMLVWSKSATQVTAKLGNTTRDYDKNAFDTLRMTGGAKADYISVSPTIRQKAFIDGKSGDDTILARAGDSVQSYVANPTADTGSIKLASGVLSVTGEIDQTNRILLWRKSSSQITVKVNDKSQNVSLSQTKSIVVTGGNKNDYISISSSLPQKATVDPKGGTDTLVLRKTDTVSNSAGNPGGGLGSNGIDTPATPAAGTIGLSSSVLTIVGKSDASNTATVKRTSAGDYVAALNGKSSTFKSSVVKAVRVVGGDRGDSITIDKSISLDTLLEGFRGNDTISGGSGKDTITFTGGQNKAYGNDGDDQITGGTGSDTLYGGTGNDQLNGGTRTGSDRLYGDAGNDVLDGGQGGNNYVDGGSGIDTAYNYSTIKNVESTPGNSGTPTPAPTPAPSPAPVPVEPIRPTTPSTPGTGGLIPANNNAAKPTAVIKTIRTTINAGQAIHVNALGSTLRNGQPTDARYEWDFGDSGSAYNGLVGWIGAHVYDKPGTYTLTLRVYNADRGLDTQTQTITVKSASRQTIYVSSSGSDGNSGTSTASPLKSWAKASELMRGKSNYEILFARGQTFDAKQTLVFEQENVRIGSYGSGAKPVIKWSGSKDRNVIVRSDGDSKDVMIDGLTFDSIWDGPDGEQAGMPLAIKPNGSGITVRGCTFLNVGYGVNANSQPTGLLVQQNDAPLVTGVRDYFLWAAGSDITVLGNKVSNVTREHVIRVSQATRLNITDNDLTNLDRRSVDRYDVAKGAITVQEGSYAYVAGNDLHAVTGVGPLGEGDGLDSKSNRFRYAVFEGNRTYNATLVINHGAEHVMVRNNIIERSGSPGIEIDGYNSTYGRGVVDLTIANNTGLNFSSSGRFLWVGGGVDGITLVNNLYKADTLYTGSYGTAGVYVNDSNLNSFTEINDNVWPVPTASGWAENGVNWIGTNPNDRTGYQDQSEWNSQGKVGTDRFQDTTLSSVFKPASNSIAANAAEQYAGVFTDFNGDARPATGAWTAGAIEA